MRITNYLGLPNKFILIIKQFKVAYFATKNTRFSKNSPKFIIHFFKKHTYKFKSYSKTQSFMLCETVEELKGEGYTPQYFIVHHSLATVDIENRGKIFITLRGSLTIN